MNTIGAELDKAWDHITHKPVTAQPAATAQPAQPEEHVTGAITADLGKVRESLDNAARWKAILDTDLPAILDRIAALEGTPYVQALQAGLLTPELSAAIDAIAQVAINHPQPELQHDTATPEPTAAQIAAQPTGYQMQQPTSEVDPA